MSMKIAFLNIYGGKVNRGAEIAVREITKRLNKRHGVTVFQSKKTENEVFNIYHIPYLPFVTTEVSHNLILRLLKKFYLDPYSLLVLFFTICCLPKLLYVRYDLLIPINGFWQIIICKIVRFFRGGKIIVLGYSGIGIDDYINLKLNPDAFFAMTHVAEIWAKTVNPHIPIKVLSGGVDTKIFHPEVTPIRLPLKPPIVLTVAALVPYKRVDLVIKAVKQLNDVSLIIAGNGILKDTVETLGKKLLPGRFMRVDIDYKHLPSLYTACNIFTLPSTHTNSSLFSRLTNVTPSEAFGIVYIEAMACGLPVVAPDDTLRREIIGQAGIFVDCTTINEYSLGLKKALMRNWNNIPRTQAKKFDWEKIVSEFSRDLTEICH